MLQFDANADANNDASVNGPLLLLLTFWLLSVQLATNLFVSRIGNSSD